MKLNLLKPIVVLIACAGFFSCHKSNSGPAAPVLGPALGKGFFTLDYGNPNYMNGVGALGFYNTVTQKSTADVYGATNAKQVVNIPRDMAIYGKKMYIINSGIIDILDAASGTLLRRDSVVTSASGPAVSLGSKYPSGITFDNGTGYISCTDGTIVTMDTISYALKSAYTLPDIQSFDLVGGIVIMGNKAYVAHTGIEGIVSNIVFVVDLASGTTIKKIAVAPSPVNFATDSYGNIYVSSSYNDDYFMYTQPVFGGLTVIDSKTDMVKASSISSSGFDGASVAVCGDLVYYLFNSTVAVFNAKTQTQVSTNFVTDGTKITFPNSICANPATGEVIVTDVVAYGGPGVVDVFDKTGKLEYTVPTGAVPIKTLLLN